MAVEVSNKQIILKGYVIGEPKESDMECRTTTVKLVVPEGSNAVVVKNLYLACDPFLRTQMMDFQGSYVHSFTPGEPMAGYGVARVIDSGNLKFKKGDLIWGITGWEEYSIITHFHDHLHKIQHTDVPISYYAGILSMVGLSAYVGLYEVGRPKKGESVFVSSAFGGVGLYFPNGIDIYFDNVGGKMLDAALVNMKVHGRIVGCGMISQYNHLENRGLHNMINIITKRLRFEGFLLVDHYDLYPKYLETALEYIREGKIAYTEEISEGLESAPRALIEFLSGQSMGKKLIIVSQE